MPLKIMMQLVQLVDMFYGEFVRPSQACISLDAVVLDIDCVGTELEWNGAHSAHWMADMVWCSAPRTVLPFRNAQPTARIEAQGLSFFVPWWEE